MSVIDLGDVSAPAGVSPPRARGRIGRGWVTVALAGALALGAAGVPPSPQVHQLWTTDMAGQDGLALTEDTAFVPRSSGGRVTMTAYDLATGAVRWIRPLDARAGELMSIVVADGMVQLGGPPAYTAIADGTMVYPTDVTVLDAATGVQRWRLPGEVMQSAPDSVLLGDRDTHGELHVLRMVGARDGVVRWERPLTGTLDAQIGYDGDHPSRIVTMSGSGDIAVYRYTDGVPLAGRRMTWTGTGLNIAALVTGERLFVTRTDPRGATITAYRLDDLSELWSQRTLRAAYLTDCGPVLCLSRGAEIAGLDAATGESRWLLAGRGGVNQAGPGRLLAYSNDEQPTQAVVDAATGRVLADAGAGWPMPASSVSGRLVLLRVSATDPTRTVISRIDPVSGRVSTIGTVASTEGITCNGTGRFLVCQRPDRIVVTALG